MFGGKKNNEIDRFANLMVEVVDGEHDSSIEDEGYPATFSPREELAYLQGYRAIEYLGLRTFGTRRLIRGFKSGLADRGMSSADIDLQVAQFWVNYWTIMVGSTAEIGGIAFRFALKRVRKSQAILDAKKQQYDCLTVG